MKAKDLIKELEKNPEADIFLLDEHQGMPCPRPVGEIHVHPHGTSTILGGVWCTDECKCDDCVQGNWLDSTALIHMKGQHGQSYYKNDKGQLIHAVYAHSTDTDPLKTVVPNPKGDN